LFALKGYHDTKLEEVQKAARVTTGAFFHHFDGKEDLGFAVLSRHMGRRRKELDQIETELPSPRPANHLGHVFRRLDAIALMVARRQHTWRLP
jgi:AcrR family transcriptional regulator